MVERQLASQGIDRRAIGREKFVEEVWKWQDVSGDAILQQMRRLGASVDWSRTYFTMDENLSQVVVETFVRLYEQGLIYRGKRLVNWDPKLQTAVADLEVETEEEDGRIWEIRYPAVEGERIDHGGNDAARNDAGRRCRRSSIRTTSAIGTWSASRCHCR